LILLDANIFLEVLLGRNRATDCRSLLDRLSRGELEGVVTRFSVHSIEAVIGGHGGDVVSFLRTVEQTSGLSVYETTTSDEISAALLAGKVRRDFDDSLQYYVAKKLGAEKIASYDRHFDGLDVPRWEPSQG
jgi:predicted nucleic acid-binding protein